MNSGKKKICIIVPAHWEAVMGGSQYQARLLIEHLIAEGGHDIYYLTRRVSTSIVPKGYRIKKIADGGGIRRFGEFLDTLDLLRILKEISPDIIYQRVGCGYTGIAAYYAKKFNKRCVWHVASDMDVVPFDRKLTRNILFRYIEKRFLEYGLRNVSAIVTQTQQQADNLWKYYKRKPNAVIPNVHPWPIEKIQKPNKPITVVWVANLKPLKRPELYIQLAKDLRAMKDVQFIMIGKPLGSRHWCQQIEYEAGQLDNMRYLGGQSQEVVNETLSKAHIFVNTSEYEGFANTFIQSWLRKVPVVSLSVNPDGVFDHHSIGICAENYGNLKESVVKLIDNEKLRQAMGDNAQGYAKEKYSIENLALLSRLIIGVDCAKAMPMCQEYTEL